jgi:O-antigen ligase
VTAESTDPGLDRAAIWRWPLRAAAHVLGIGLAIAVLIALPVAPSDLDRHQFPKETVVHLAVFLAVVLARPWPPVGASRALRVAALGLVTWSVVSALGATNPWLAFRATAITLTGVAALFTARHVAAHGGAGVLLGWAAVAAGLGAMTGLAQAFGMAHPFFAELRAPGGTFGNRNFLAHLGAVALPMLCLLLLGGRRRMLVVIAGLAIVVISAALVLTRSRAGWLAAATGIGAMTLAILSARRRAGLPLPTRRVGWLGLLVVTGLTAAITLPNSLEWRSDSPYADTLGNLTNFREGSGRGRLLQYQNSLELAGRHPVTGVGPGNWPLHYGDVAPRSDPSWASDDIVPLNPWPSSDWIAMISERGIPAVLAAVVLGLALLWRGWRGVAAGGHRAMYGATLVGTLVAVFVAGAFDAVLLLAVPTLFAATCIGALLDGADGGTSEVRRPAASRGATVLAVLLAAVLLRSGTQLGAYLIAGDGSDRERMERAVLVDPFNYQLRIALGRGGPCNQARRHARAALELAPTWRAPQRAVARCGG